MERKMSGLAGHGLGVVLRLLRVGQVCFMRATTGQEFTGWRDYINLGNTLHKTLIILLGLSNYDFFFFARVFLLKLTLLSSVN